MSDSLTVDTTPYMPEVLARAAGSQTWWLLEPGIGARRRVIRFVLLRAGSARVLKETVDQMNKSNDVVRPKLGKFRVSDCGEGPAQIQRYASSLRIRYEWLSRERR